MIPSWGNEKRKTDDRQLTMENHYLRRFALSVVGFEF
jgi:hypothetical protein